LVGAHVFNLHGDTIHVADIVAEIQRAWPDCMITHSTEPLPIPAEMDDAAIRAVMGQLSVTPIAQGVRETVQRFAELHSEGRLDTSDLDQ
jgi:hypothetical protein